MTDPLLQVENLAVEFRSGRRVFRAVDGVSFDVEPGETVAVVGESGSGKTTIGRAVLGLTPVAEGRVRFRGEDVTHRTRRRQRALARDMQVVFQNPYSSLNPSKTIGDILLEPVKAQRPRRDTDAASSLAELIERVGLPADTLSRYPSRFSGGQRQRIAIARALVMDPSLVICDEPTSALDVSTQAAVLTLLRELQTQLRLSYVFITHDLAVVRNFADRVIVLRQGQMVESGPVEEVCAKPRAAYTQQLLAAAPVPDPIVQRQRREARRNGAAA